MTSGALSTTHLPDYKMLGESGGASCQVLYIAI